MTDRATPQADKINAVCDSLAGLIHDLRDDPCTTSWTPGCGVKSVYGPISEGVTYEQAHRAHISDDDVPAASAVALWVRTRADRTAAVRVSRDVGQLARELLGNVAEHAGAEAHSRTIVQVEPRKLVLSVCNTGPHVAYTLRRIQGLEYCVPPRDDTAVMRLLSGKLGPWGVRGCGLALVAFLVQHRRGRLHLVSGEVGAYVDANQVVATRRDVPVAGTGIVIELPMAWSGKKASP